MPTRSGRPRPPLEDLVQMRLDAFEQSVMNGPLPPHPSHFKVRELVALVRELRATIAEKE
jgi:hypothetical protein